MKKIQSVIIEFDRAWVLEHRADDVLPVDKLYTRLEQAFGDKLISGEKSYTTVKLKVDSPEEAEAASAIASAVCELFPFEIGSQYIELKIEQTDFDETEKQGESEDASSVAARDGASDGQKDGQAKPRADKPDKAAARKKAIDDARAKIRSLVGAEEFKKLADEIVKIAPQIIENGTRDIFLHRSYLFSINDGYGLTTSLMYLAELIDATGISAISRYKPIAEEKLPPLKDSKDGMEPFEKAITALNRSDDKTRILCIDISEWMSATNNRYFKDFLRLAESAEGNCIVVFRIPFVDKEIRDKIKNSLNDLMYVHTVSFPPFTTEEIRSCAVREIGKYGFKVSAKAWKHFHDRMTEERSDGKFYGLNTVKKVVRELLYIKQLNNAEHKTNSRLISERDMRALGGSGEDGLSGFEMLDRMVGSGHIRQRIEEIIAQIELSLKSGGPEKPCIHMRFLGNPGTGKTTVARIVGKILTERGVLRLGTFFEYAGRDFCGRYIGETAPKTAGICRDAYGGVLFIDEAYSLFRGDDNDRDFGREALDTLIAEMENHRNDFVVIMAGYTDDMNKMMSGNQGLRSRMPYTIEFPNFTKEQLYEIFVSMLQNVKHDEGILSAAHDYFLGLPTEVTEAKDFSNARFVRNLFERTGAKAAMRCQLQKEAEMCLTRDDFERSIGEKEFADLVKKKSRIGFI